MTDHPHSEVATHIVGKSVSESLQILNEKQLMLKVYKRDGDVKHVLPMRDHAVYCIVEDDTVTEVVAKSDVIVS